MKIKSMDFSGTLVIIMTIFIFVSTLYLLFVSQSLISLRDIMGDIIETGPGANEINYFDPSSSIKPSYAEFLSNDGISFRIAVDTLLNKQAGLLDAKIRHRNSIQIPMFVDIPGSLLESVLNYYRYDVFKCPPEEKMDPVTCKLALNQYLPGVQGKLPSTKKTVEISFSVDYSGIDNVAIIVAPLGMMTWIDSIISQLDIPARPNEPMLNHNIETKHWKLQPGGLLTDARKIHMALIKNAPDRYCVSTVSSVIGKGYGIYIILRVEDLES